MMKTILVAITALALMGGQVFAAADYKVSDYKGEDLKVSATSVTVSVDDVSQIKSCNLNVRTLELVYEEGMCLNVKGSVTLGTQGVIETRNIIPTAAAAQEWIDKLVAGEKVTLISAYMVTIVGSPLATLLQGAQGGSTITLTGTTDTLTAHYRGLSATTLTNLADGDIYLHRSVDSKTLTLEGKGLTATPIATTPEPATAPLSLLALAGLAVRRRRK